MFLHTKAKLKRPEQDPTFGLFDEGELPARRIYLGVDPSPSCPGKWHTRVRDLGRPLGLASIVWERPDIAPGDLDRVVADEISALFVAGGESLSCVTSDQPAVGHWLRRTYGEETDLGTVLRRHVPDARAILLVHS